MDAPYPLISAVVNAPVGEPEIADLMVAGELVGADRRAGRNVRDQMRFKGPAAHVVYDAGDNVPAPLDHSEHDRLAGSPASALAWTLPADVGLVGLDVPTQHGIAVYFCHMLSDLVPHAPRRLISYAKLALEFLGGDSMPRRGEQVHGVEPLLKGRTRVFEQRACHWVDVVAALTAGVGRFLLDFVKLCFLPALGAGRRFSKARMYEVVEAYFVAGEPLEKLECRGHWIPPYPLYIGSKVP